MATEIEFKLALSPAAARALPRHPLLAGQHPASQRLLNTYYDTPRLDLRRRKVALRFRNKGWDWLLTVKSAEPASGGLARRSEWEAPAAPGRWDFSHVGDAGLRRDLEAATPQLEAVFTTDFRRTAWELAFGESRIELALDRGTIESKGRKSPICEVELELLAGQVADLFALAGELQATLPLRPSIASKAERGYALFRDQTPRPFKARPLVLPDDIAPRAAFRQIALACLEQLQRNEAGILHDPDPEYVHQARVALRRLRSAINVFAPVLPPAFTTTWSAAWKNLAGAFGDTRNWDVFTGETLPPIAAAFPTDRSTRRLLATGRRKAGEARRTLARVLLGDDYPRQVTQFTAALFALDDTATLPLRAFALERLSRRARQARRLARRPTGLTDDSARHALRISLKKLRYPLEFFAPLLPPHRFKPYLAALTHLQDELGRINDHVTAIELVAMLPGDFRNTPILGWLQGRHALLVMELPESLGAWLAQRLPGKL